MHSLADFFVHPMAIRSIEADHEIKAEHLFSLVIIEAVHLEDMLVRHDDPGYCIPCFRRFRILRVDRIHANRGENHIMFLVNIDLYSPEQLVQIVCGQRVRNLNVNGTINTLKALGDINKELGPFCEAPSLSHCRTSRSTTRAASITDCIPIKSC